MSEELVGVKLSEQPRRLQLEMPLCVGGLRMRRYRCVAGSVAALWEVSLSGRSEGGVSIRGLGSRNAMSCRSL